MPNYTHDIPKTPEGPSLPVRRTPTNSALLAIVTSEDLIGCHTHFYQGHTVPCEGTDCPAHRDGIPFRWHAYLSAIETKSNLHFLFECTAQAAEQFVQYREAYKTLRGCFFQAKRWKPRVNSRVIIQTKPCKLDEVILPSPPDLVKVLDILWGLGDKKIDGQRRNPDRNMPTTRITPAPTRGNNTKKKEGQFN